MNFNKEKYLKYLPSKKFLFIASFLLVLAIIIFVIFFMPSAGKDFINGDEKNSKGLTVENPTLNDLIQKDSDNDSVADWEENLWGTDKNKKITFANTPDATYIENKKKELNIEQSIDQQSLTETEKFAREFFTSYSAMKSFGELDTNTINNFSNALGQKIVDPKLVDRYVETNVKINDSDNTVDKQKYYEAVQDLFNEYKSSGLGEELSVVSNQFSVDPSGNTINNEQTNKLLTIANSSNNTGISVSNMAKITSDPVVGLSGLSQYQKYSDDLVKAVTDLETFLEKQ